MFSIQMISPVTADDELLELPTDMEPKLATLLHTYRTVFHTPSGLPPSRVKNHAIILQEDTKPVKTRPYRYPHSLKNRLRSWCKTCLAKALFKTATTHFPFLLCWSKRKMAIGAFVQIIGL